MPVQIICCGNSYAPASSVEIYSPAAVAFAAYSAKITGMISYYILYRKNEIMRYSFSIIATIMLFAIFSSCNNAGNATANAADTLNTDSTAIAGIDHTAVAKDSGTMATAIPVDNLDKAFIVKAISGNTLEMDLGNLASQTGKSAGVKRFGDMMVKDQTDVNTSLRNIAKQLQVPVPDSMIAQHSRYRMELTKKKGTAFDKAYIKLMIENHKETITDFQGAAASNNATIKNFATQVLPLLARHLDSAKVIGKGI